MALNIQSSALNKIKDEGKSIFEKSDDAAGKTLVSQKGAVYNRNQLNDALVSLMQGMQPKQTLRAPVKGENQTSYYLPEGAVSEKDALDEYTQLLGQKNVAQYDTRTLQQIAGLDPAQYNAAVRSYKDRLQAREAQYSGDIDFSTMESGQQTVADMREFVNRIRRSTGEQIDSPTEAEIRYRQTSRRNPLRDSDKVNPINDSGIEGLVDITMTQIEDGNMSEERTFLSKKDGSQINNYDKGLSDFGVRRDEQKKFASVSTLALATFASVIKRHKYGDQAITDYFGISLPGDESLPMQGTTAGDSVESEINQLLGDMRQITQATETGQRPPIPKDISFQAYKEGLEGFSSQPILRGMLFRLDRFIRDKMFTDERRRAPSNNLSGAGMLLQYWVEKGYMGWGKTRKGYIIPIIDHTSGIGKLQDNELAPILNPELRSERLAGRNAPTFPLTSNFGINTEGDWKQILGKGKDYTGETRGFVSQAFLSMMNRNPVQIDELRTQFLQMMTNQVEETFQKDLAEKGYSDHPLAEVIGEISKKHYDVYAEREKPDPEILDRQDRPTAKSLINKHWTTIKNRIGAIANKYNEQKSNNYKYFPLYYKSNNTGRYYIDDTLFNHINDKGLIRTVLKVGDSPAINLRENKSDNELLELSRNIYKPKGTGIQPGLNINNELQALASNDRQMLGFYYALGHIAAEFLNSDSNFIMNKGRLNNPSDFIDLGIKNFKIAVEHGNRLLSYLPNIKNPQGSLPDFTSDNVNPIDRAIFKKKGEWQYPVSILTDAAKLSEALGKSVTPTTVSAEPTAREQELLKEFYDSNLSDTMSSDEFLLQNGVTPSPQIREEQLPTPKPTFKFSFVFEEDARQSNAALIATLIGDYRTAALLGLLPEQYEKIREEAIREGKIAPKDLRDELTSNMPEMVKLALNNPDKDGVEREALTKYFNAVMKNKELNGSRIISRGLIIAGLYGKTPTRMYSEALDMLGQTPTEKTILDNAYSNDRQRMLRDISAVYTAMSRQYLSGLMGYQDVLKDVGLVTGLFEGSTELPGLLENENINTAFGQILPMETSKVLGDAIKAEQASVNIDGFSYPTLKTVDTGIFSSPTVMAQEATRLREEQLRAVQKENPDFDPDEVVPETYTGRGVLGTGMRRSLPVNIIQNMDSLALSIAFMVARGDDLTKARQAGKEELYSGRPPAATAVHDALITTADSILTINNGYNNVAPHILATKGMSLMKRLEVMAASNFLNHDFTPEDGKKWARDSDGKLLSRVGLGTELKVNKDGKLINKSQISDFFDNIYYNTLNKFYTKEEGKRFRVTKDSRIIEGQTLANFEKELKEENQIFLDIASANGWKSPQEYSAEERKNYTVSREEYLRLKTMIMERAGLVNKNIENFLDKYGNYQFDRSMVNVSEKPKDKRYMNSMRSKQIEKYEEQHRKARKKYSESKTYKDHLKF